MSYSGFKIVIADTQFLVIEALKSLLGHDERFSIIKIVNSHHELHNVLVKETCQLLITDSVLVDFDRIDNLQTIKHKFPGLSVLILTNSISKTEFTELSKIGIKNIIYKTAERDEILAAIDATLRGKKYYSDEILDIILELGESK